MNQSISRAQFLRGDFRGRHRAIRPPWSLPESAFISLCTRCGDCVDACETGLLTQARGGFPAADFRRGECTFCGRCAERCTSGAIGAPHQDAPWTLRAHIDEPCLAHRRVVCRTCGEQCEAGAIRFRMAPGGVSRPELDIESCTGCGACVGPCPVSAITLSPSRVQPPAARTANGGVS